MACVSSALVVGSGVAGLTVAANLVLGGVRCDLVEAASAPVGASILISGHALENLLALGGRERLLAAGLLDPLGRRGVYRSLGIYRPALAEILKDAALEAGVALREGVRLTGLRSEEPSVVACFADGSERVYDAVIGADGLRSTVRSLVAPEAALPQYSGQSCIRWMTPGDPVPGLAGTIHLPFGKLLSYPLPGQIYSITVFTYPRRDAIVDQAEARRMLQHQLGACADEGVKVLHSRLTPEISLIFRPFEWLLMPRPWSRGRIVLVGDAAHATTAHMGYGGGLAIEDGVVLAEAMLSADSLTEAYDSFETRRFDRVRHVVETSLTLSRMEQADEAPETLETILLPALERLNAPY